MNQTQRKGFTGRTLALAGVTSLLWGFSFAAMDILMEVYDPVQILALRWAVAALIFLVLLLAGKIRLSFRGKTKRWIILTAIAEPCLYAIFEIYGVKMTSASISSVFIATIPCMTLITGIVFFKQHTSKKGIIGIILAFAGVVICTAFNQGAGERGQAIGYLFLLSAVTVGALYAHYSARAGAEYSTLSITAFMTFCAGFWFFVLNQAMGYGLGTYTAVFCDWKLLAGTMFLGICCSAVCYLGFNFVLQSVTDTALADNVVASLVTVVGVIAGIAIRGDAAGIHTAIGLVLTITGIVISSRAA